ncbi:MAG: hypothetical protein JNK87_24175 [Bryobacterales bacterium]|nr:hypothetical protein [Bryobacterales bacterium]
MPDMPEKESIDWGGLFEPSEAKPPQDPSEQGKPEEPGGAPAAPPLVFGAAAGAGSETSVSGTQPQPTEYSLPLPVAMRTRAPRVQQSVAETTPIPAAASNSHIGIIGPTNSGKTYLFQALAYQLSSPTRYGVLSRFMKPNSVHLYRCTGRDRDKGEMLPLDQFNRDYQNWTELPPTDPGTAKWFHLTFDGPSGWWGTRDKSMKITFVDVSGEDYAASFNLADKGRDTHEGLRANIWHTYADARVMVFCLPIWVAFPGSNMQASDWAAREGLWQGFLRVFANYVKLRKEVKNQFGRQRTRIVLALTHGDDQRSALYTLRQEWIDTYIHVEQTVRDHLASRSGATEYLAVARSISSYIRDEFARLEEPALRDLPGRLVLDGEQPWFIPVTAVDGAILESGGSSSQRPTPAHVDLPVLLALCDSDNLLM